MKTTSLLSSIVALAVFATTAQADINSGLGAYAPQPGGIRGNCDLMATNTVRATFKGLKDVPASGLEADSAATAKVALFEVIENLAHRRLVRYGDGAMPAGMIFTVAMDKQMPGQPADIVDTISQMQEGEETVMRIDHLFLYGDPDGKFLRPCARMARRTATPAPVTQDEASGEPAPALPTSVAPLTGNGSVSIGSGTRTASSRSVSIRTVPDGQGGFKTYKEETISELLPGTNEIKTRMFINDVEVDPHTRQPIASTPAQAQPAAAPAAPATPAAAPAPTPAPASTPQSAPASAPAPATDDDTIVENDSF